MLGMAVEPLAKVQVLLRRHEGESDRRYAEESVQFLRGELQKNQMSLELWGFLSEASTARRDRETARAATLKTLELMDPSDARVLSQKWRLAVVLHHLGRTDDARHAYQVLSRELDTRVAAELVADAQALQLCNQRWSRRWAASEMGLDAPEHHLRPDGEAVSASTTGADWMPKIVAKPRERHVLFHRYRQSADFQNALGRDEAAKQLWRKVVELVALVPVDKREAEDSGYLGETLYDFERWSDACRALEKSLEMPGHLGNTIRRRWVLTRARAGLRSAAAAMRG